MEIDTQASYLALKSPQLYQAAGKETNTHKRMEVISEVTAPWSSTCKQHTLTHHPILQKLVQTPQLSKENKLTGNRACKVNTPQGPQYLVTAPTGYMYTSYGTSICKHLQRWENLTKKLYQLEMAKVGNF